MPRIVAVDVRFPPRYFAQEELGREFLRVAGGRGEATPERIQRLFTNVGVEGRHMVLPLDEYPRLGGFAERSEIWLRHALELGTAAVDEALARAGLTPGDISLFASTTVTGIAVPSLESRIMGRLDFDSSCRRLPLFGLGCVAGASGIARVSEYLRARPRDAAILLSVELCSLTFQLSDTSVANVVASALFGDAAACVVLVGDEHPMAEAAKGPFVGETRAVLFPDTERVMGWDIVDSGFRVVLSGAVPDLARGPFSASVRAFLRERCQQPSEIMNWIAHPGGPAVIDAIEGSLGLAPGVLDRTRDCLRRVGNLSSASVLVLLSEVLGRHPAEWPWDPVRDGAGICRRDRIAAMVTKVAFTVLVVVVAVQRFWELQRSRRNEVVLLAQGAREHARWQVPVMAALHSLWLVACSAEVWMLATPFHPVLAMAALALFGAGQWLRAAAMRALGPRWTIRVMTLPGAPPVVGGIYRYLRHPNYAGVVLEIAALPLVHGAVRTALIATIANAVLLAFRIRAEEQALSTDNAYLEYFGAGGAPASPSRRRRVP